MKKVFKFMAIALAACGMSMFTACGEDPEPNPGEQEQPGDPILLEEHFDGTEMPTDWATVDADGDSYTWKVSNGAFSNPQPAGHNGSAGFVFSQSYNNTGALTPDNWLISPAINIPNGKYSVEWYACGQDAEYAHEYYEVHVGTMNSGRFTSSARIYSGYADDAKDQSEWKRRSAALADFAGQEIYIAFRHCNTSDVFYLDIDDVKVYDNTL